MPFFCCTLPHNSYNVERNMIQVYRLVADLPQVVTVKATQSAEWYGSSEEAFVYSNRTQQVLKWWPPSRPDAPPMLALVKLNTNSSRASADGGSKGSTTSTTSNPTTTTTTTTTAIDTNIGSGSRQVPVYLSANCSLLQTLPANSKHDEAGSRQQQQQHAKTAPNLLVADHWRVQTLGEQINLPLGKCSLNEEGHFYYQCDDYQHNLTGQARLPTGAALLYIRQTVYSKSSGSHEQVYLLGLYIGTNKRTGKMGFLALNRHFLGWTVKQMTATVLFSAKATTIFWCVFIGIFNVLPFLMLWGPLFSLLPNSK